MNKRILGNSGLEIAPLVFGGNVFGWTIDRATSFNILDAFVAEGFDCIDTADVYSGWAPGNKGGESETIIGQWLKQSGKRSKVTIATKVGKPMGPDKKGLSAAYIIEAVEASLTRLQTDVIDLYQSHDDDTNTPLEETLEAYSRLIKQGKVRAIGASNFSADRLAQSLETSATLGVPGYQCLQPLYNLYDRADFENALQALCVEKNIGVIPFYALASGFLTGKYRSITDTVGTIRGAKAKTYLNDRGLRILAALDHLANELDSNPARIAIAWLLSRPGITAPIASATSLTQLHELIAGVRLPLPASALRLLDEASAP